MTLVKRASKFLLAIYLFVGQWAHAISDEMHAFVRLETKSNAISFRSNSPVTLENFEIPIEHIVSDVSERADIKALDALVVERGGRQFVRWVINPEDTEFYKDVEYYLRKNGLSTQKYKYFTGYRTASRSYIVVDPESKVEFSLKVSTDRTGGQWKSKKQSLEDAVQIRQITEFVFDELKKVPELKHVILLDEPMIFGIKDLDMAMVFRSYEGLSHSGKRYVPGFAVMHDKTGRALAKANGSDDPAAYWNEHYNKPLARAIAEFLAITGLTYDSPHSQNFLVELDHKNRPTGKIVLRDFGDVFVTSNFLMAKGRADILQNWPVANVLTDKFCVNIGILHGNNPPSWMNLNQNILIPAIGNSSYDKWARDFYGEFEKEFKAQTGFELPSSAIKRSASYISREYHLHNEQGWSFLSAVAQGSQRDPFLKKLCRKVFAE